MARRPRGSPRWPRCHGQALPRPRRQRPRGLSQSEVTAAAAGREAANQRRGRGARPCGRRRHVGRGRDRAVTRGRDKGAARAFPRRRLKGTALAPRRPSDRGRAGPARPPALPLCAPWVCRGTRGAASASCPGHEPPQSPVRAAGRDIRHQLCGASGGDRALPRAGHSRRAQPDGRTDSRGSAYTGRAGQTARAQAWQDRRAGSICLHAPGSTDGQTENGP